MASLRISFDRGTLRLDGDVGGLGELARFDPRTEFHRASGFQYVALLERSLEQHVDVHDEVASAAFAAPRCPPPPTLRPYQEQAIKAWGTFGRRGIVALPTGSGKTRVACALIAAAKLSVLVLVPTVVLLEQWAHVLGEHLQQTIGVVGDGQSDLRPITVMTFESAYRQLDRFGHRFGMLVVDEAHHFAGGLRSEALEMCTAKVRLGLTATPPLPGTKGAGRLAELIGPVVFELEIADLSGTDLAALELLRIHVALTPEERRTYEESLAPFSALRREILRTHPGADWATCVQAIARTPGGAEVLAGMARAGALASFPSAKRDVVRGLLARHRADRTLLFTARADDAFAIAEDSLLPVIAADVSRTERDWILTAFRERRVPAICSARVLNEGVDVPEANVAIIVAGALGAREHVQRIGRILRPAEGKTAIAYELVTLDTIDEARTRARGGRFAARPAAHDHGA